MPGGGRQPGAGRPKGALNKINADVRGMILGALTEAGGQEYLVQQAAQNPAAFLSLLSKVLPTKLEGTMELHNFVMRAPLPIESADEWLKLHAPSDSRELQTTDE